jgi:Hypothetical protein (DUF2513)
MKRDMDTIRELLLWMEKQPDNVFFYADLPDMGGREFTIAHAQMLLSGGYLEQSQQRTLRVSWQGYEFLEQVRDPDIWTKAKTGAGKVGSWSIKLLGDLAAGYVRAKAAELGLPIA